MTLKIERKINQATRAEISEIFKKLRVDDSIFHLDFSQISKHLLNEFLAIKVYSVDFKVLSEAYLKNIESDSSLILKEKSDIISELLAEVKNKAVSSTANEKVFHQYICKTYFGLSSEPKEELLKAFLQATKDINEIDKTLSDIKTKLDAIFKRNLASEIQEEKPILYYYQELNDKARKQIIEFIKEGIKTYALNACYDNSIFGSMSARVPYVFNWNPKSYIPRVPNDLENKFGSLLLPEFRRVNDLYKNHRDKFNTYLHSYISKEEITSSILSLLDEHHILAIRREIISEAINTYESGGQIMFANAVPTMIEGILHDLCLLIGETENNLLSEGFQYKLNKLQDVLGVELHYEYYSFRFRLFRNKVAHGRLNKSDVLELSDLLLLDLYHICQLVHSDKFQLNHKRFVINEISKRISNPDFKFVMKYLLLSNTEIPKFYRLDSQIKKIERLILTDEFWEFLENEMTKGGESANHGVHLVLKAIASRKPVDKRCAALLKKSGLKSSNTKIAEHYLKYLTRDF